MNRNIAITVFMAACAAAAGAQPVYRCGSSYSQQPCPGGTAVAATDPGSGDAARARAAAKVDAQRAAAYEKARLAQEKQAPKAIVMAPPPSQAASAPKVAARPASKPAKKGGKPEHFTAVGPKPAK